MTVGMIVGGYFVAPLVFVFVLRSLCVSLRGIGQRRKTQKVLERSQPLVTTNFHAFVETHWFWDKSPASSVTRMSENQLYAVFWGEAQPEASASNGEQTRVLEAKLFYLDGLHTRPQNRRYVLPDGMGPLAQSG